MNLQVAIVVIGFIIYIVSFFTKNRFMATGSILVLLMLWISGILDLPTAFAGFVDNTAISMISVFILSSALSKTPLLTQLGGSIAKRAKSELQFMIGLSLIVVFLSFFLSGQMLFVMLGPAIFSMCKQANISPKRILKPANDMYCMWGGMLPIGFPATIYIMINSLIESYGGTPTMTFWTVPLAQLPIAILASIYIIFSYKMCPKDWAGLEGEEDNLVATSEKQAEKAAARVLPHKWQHIVVYVVFLAVMIGIATSSITGISIGMLAAIGCIVLLLTGVIDEAEAIRTIPFSIICVYATGLALGKALTASGGMDLLQVFLEGVLGSLANPFVIGAFIFLAALIITQFVQNGVVKNLFQSLTIPLAIALGWDPRALYVLGFLGAQFAVLTPMGSLTANIIFKMGNYSNKEYMKQGLPTFIIVLIAGAIIIPLMYPAFS